MHDEKRQPAKAEQPVKCESNPKVLPGPIAEGYMGLSALFRHLLSLDHALKEAKGEARSDAFKQALEFLKRHDFAPSDVRADQFDKILKLLDSVFEETLEKVNTTSPDSISARVELFDTVRIERGAGYVLAISDPNAEAEKNPIIARLIDAMRDELSGFKCVQQYLAHLLVYEDLVGIQIDHGMHKGYLAAFCPKDGGDVMLYFRHFEHAHSQFHTNRAAFIHDSLRSLRFHGRQFKSKHTGYDIRAMGFRDGGEWVGAFKSLVRLSRAVKDLDLALRSRRLARCAHLLFEDGVANMFETLSFASEGKKDPQWIDRIINPNERIALMSRLEDVTNARDIVTWIQKRHDSIRKAKDLNFEILTEITGLQLAVQKRINQGQLVPKREVNARFPRIKKKVMEFASLCDGMREYCLSMGEFSQKAAQVLEKYEQAISGCESWVLDDKDLAVIMGMAADKGGNLELSKVDTIEELVRFLHSRVVLSYSLHSHGRDVNSSKNLVFLDCADEPVKKFVCLNAAKNLRLEDLEAYRILNSLLRDLDSPSILGNGRVIAILGTDFVDITMPMGKHYAEITADVDEKNNCCLLRLRYIETEYQYAKNRKKYVEMILKQLGFTIEPSPAQEHGNGRHLAATLRTEDSSRWSICYSELVRLMISAADLDLSGHDPETFGELFSNGFTTLKSCCLFLADFSGSDSECVHSYGRILSNSSLCEGDKRAFTDLFMKKFGYGASRIVPLLGHFSVDELDKILVYITDLEINVREQGNKKKAGKLKRLGDKLEELVVGKESQ